MNQLRSKIVMGKNPITISDIVKISSGTHFVQLNSSKAWRVKMNKSVRFLQKKMDKEKMIYGVTTGFGDSCTTNIPPNKLNELPRNLTRFHGVGMGRNLTSQECKALMATRVASLVQGYSGIRYEILERILEFINLNVIPFVPEEGSVGASGDLTPLSYIAAAVIGERDVSYCGKRTKMTTVLKKLNLQALELRPKEGLAIMNGTSLMTAFACLAFDKAYYLTKLAARITSLSVISLNGNPGHFKSQLFTVKPFPGQSKIASWISRDLKTFSNSHKLLRVQDRYSIRCAPHVIGVLQDCFPWMQEIIETELNSCNDNPIIFPDTKEILHGGHFYGGHIAMVMDTMKCQVANIADLLDRQLALLVDPKFNNGLPANLSGNQNNDGYTHHGFKAVQIAVSAWTAEALKLTMPASVFSRSTECHNQDKVSMGTIAARDCLRVIELTTQVTSALLLAVTQAIDLKIQTSDLKATHLGSTLKKFHQLVLKDFDVVNEDRPLESDLKKFVNKIKNKSLPLY